MGTNRYRTVIYQKHAKKVLYNNNYTNSAVQKEGNIGVTRLEHQLQKMKPHPYRNSLNDSLGWRGRSSNFKIGDSVIHSSLGKGTIKSTIKSVTNSTLALVVVFEEYSKPKTVNLPCEEIKKIQNTY